MPTKRDPRAPCRPNDPPSLHEQLIRDLVASDARMCRNGFWQAMAALCDELDEDGPLSRHTFGFLPDAYLIDREACEIMIYEVEHYGRLSDHKLSAVGAFWDWWDGSGAHDWLPRLILVDRFGSRSEIDLAAHAFA